MRSREDDGDQVGEEEGVSHPGPQQGHLRGRGHDYYSIHNYSLVGN